MTGNNKSQRAKPKSSSSGKQPTSTRSSRLTHKSVKASGTAASRKNVKQASNPGSKRSAESRIREQQAFQLRLQGFSYTAIGQRLGISHVSAWQAVMRVLEGIEKDLTEKAPAVRQMELNRLDRHLEKLEPKIKKGDVKAIETALKVGHMRCRILGVYPAEEVKHSGEITVIHQMSDAAIDLEIQTLISADPSLKELAAGLIDLERAPEVIDVTATPVAATRVNGKANGKA